MIVLDASAFLALLKREAGADIVQASLNEAVIGAVNLGEAAQVQYNYGWRRNDFERAIAMTEITVVPVTHQIALDAADFRELARKKGISQADCLCLALAKSEDAVALTADREWLKIADDIGARVQLIR